MVVPMFESVDEILWCDHSNDTSPAVLLHGTICFVGFEKIKFRSLATTRSGIFLCRIS